MNQVMLEKSRFESVNRAFSKQSVYFDEYDYKNQILVDMRAQVRAHVLRFLKPNQKMLELNAGTGLDAVFFAEQGCQVYATELSNGMIVQLQENVQAKNLQNQIQIQQCSYTELDQVPDNQFDYVFSNFGGLNCIADLQEVNQFFPRLLKPQAFITLVLMPKISPWEIFAAWKGNFKYAFRRFAKNGTMAHLEGEYFKTYYFSPAQVLKSFGKDYRLVKLEGLGAISPPPDREKFPQKYPKIYQNLRKIDAWFRHRFPFNAWADHFIITLQYCP